MTIVLALYGVIGAQHDAEHQGQSRMCFYQLVRTTDDVAEECLVAGRNDVSSIGKKMICRSA